MTVRVGINGFGRIGRNFFRAVRASGADIEIVGVNDLTDNATLAHLLKYDIDPGPPRRRRRRPPTPRSPVGDQEIAAFAERDPANLKWADLGADVVVESTGFFTDATKARAHVDGGAKKVIISAPATNEDITVVMGVNHEHYDPDRRTRDLQRVVHHQLPGADGEGAQRRVRHRQGPDDDHPRLHRRPEPPGQHPQGPAPRPRRRAQHRADLDRCREGDRPGAAGAQGQARRLRAAGPGPDRLGDRPDLRGRPRDRRSTRSTPRSRRPPTAASCSYSTDPIVSSDIVTDPASCIFDAPLTKVIGNQVKVVGWYDNEWGYSNRLADLITLRRRVALTVPDTRTASRASATCGASGSWSAPT